MLLTILRALFILLMAAVGWSFIKDPNQKLGEHTWLTLFIAITAGVFFLCVDILAPRKKLVVFSGAFLGLIVGLSIAYALHFATPLLVDQFINVTDRPLRAEQYEALIDFINLLVGIVACYLSISFIMQTKDDFRFVIPYVEFSKQTKGARPIIVDTSVLIDGRIVDIAASGILESQLIVPQFVIDELQQIADSADKLKRNRGRRGLDVVQQLRSDSRADVVLYDSSGRHLPPDIVETDQLLTHLAKDLNGRILTNDFNLNKVAQLRGVAVININDLANALKPVVLPGEKMSVRLIKPGEESGQGVGYLADGTMVVVEHGKPHLNEDVEFTVTSMMQTKAGRMIFGRLGDSDGGNHKRGRGNGAPDRQQ